MKNIALLFICSSLAVFNTATAQQFVNGSFEPVNTGLGKCKYDSLSEFNMKMGGMWATGADTGMYLADNSCGMGAPANGNYYVGTSYKAMTGSNYIMLRLTSPMQPNVKYKFSFSYKGPSSGTALTPLLGYSNDSLNHSNFVHGITAPTGSAWHVMNDSVTPTAISKYIWIAGSSAGGDGQVYFDNFVMVQTGTSVAQAAIDAGIEVYPNPVTDVAHIKLGAGIKSPVAITICDITGKVLVHTTNVSQKDISINKADLGTGIHILKVTDADNNNYTTKLIAD